MDAFLGALSGSEIVLLAVGSIVLAVGALGVMVYFLITWWSD